MNCCKSDQCRGIESVFDTRLADGDLAEYRRDGPSRMTGILLDFIREIGVRDASVLDVGGGVGAIQHELVRSGADRVINVDASPAYSHVARSEAERQGYVHRAEYHVGDFVTIAPKLDDVDILTMDRVICCYDDVHGLLSAAVSRARRAIGLVYPPDRWLLHAGSGVINLYQKLTRNPFRTFIHPTATVDRIVRGAGFEQRHAHRGFLWQVVVYTR